MFLNMFFRVTTWIKMGVGKKGNASGLLRERETYELAN